MNHVRVSGGGITDYCKRFAANPSAGVFPEARGLERVGESLFVAGKDRKDNRVEQAFRPAVRQLEMRL